MKNKRTQYVFLFLTIAFLLIGSIGAWVIATSGGHMKITQITIPTDYGKHLTANLYKPDTATPENPAPVVVKNP